jgi:hypothetical protein
MTERVKYEGVPVYLNGRNYIIPSLSVKDLKLHYDTMTSSATEGIKLSEVVENFFPVILSAIRRNYPEVTLENLYDWIDLNSFPKVVGAIRAATGLETTTTGEAAPTADQ